MSNVSMCRMRARKRNDGECCEHAETGMSNAGGSGESFGMDVSVVRKMEANLKKMNLKVKQMEIDMKIKLMEIEMAEMKRQKLELDKSGMMETEDLQTEDLEMNTSIGNCVYTQTECAGGNVIKEEKKEKKKEKKKHQAEKTEKERKKTKEEKREKYRRREKGEEVGKRRSIQMGNDMDDQEGVPSPLHHEDSSTEKMTTLCDATAESMSADEQFHLARKIKKEKKKELRRQALEAGQPRPSKKKKVAESFRKDRALDYLKRWKESNDDWKFNKKSQVWLLRNMFKICEVPEDYFSILLEYIEPLNGSARNETIKKGAMLLKDLKKGESQEDDIDLGRIKDVLDVLS